MTQTRWNMRFAAGVAAAIVAVAAIAAGGCASSHRQQAASATAGAVAVPTKYRPVPPQIQREFANALKQYNQPHPPHH